MDFLWRALRALPSPSLQLLLPFPKTTLPLKFYEDNSPVMLCLLITFYSQFSPSSFLEERRGKMPRIKQSLVSSDPSGPSSRSTPTSPRIGIIFFF